MTRLRQLIREALLDLEALTLMVDPFIRPEGQWRHSHPRCSCKLLDTLVDGLFYRLVMKHDRDVTC